MRLVTVTLLAGNALIGILLSAVAAIFALRGGEVLPGSITGLLLLLLLISVVGVGVIQLGLGLQRRLPPGAQLSGCPSWLRWAVLVSVYVSAASLLYFGFVEPRSTTQMLAPLRVGLFGTIVHPALLGLAISYLRLPPVPGRKCRRGHEVPVGEASCPDCGELLETVS